VSLAARFRPRGGLSLWLGAALVVELITPQHEIDFGRRHRLDVIDKHKMMLAGFGAISAANGYPFVPDHWNGTRYISSPLGAAAILEKGQELRFPNAQIDKNSTFLAELVFDEPGVAEGYPVILALRQFWREVDQIAGKLSLYLR